MKKLTYTLWIVVIIIIINNSLIAQWMYLPFPYTPTCFVNSGTKLFAGTFQKGLYYSTNYGEEWSMFQQSGNYRTLFLDDTILFAGTSKGAYRSTDNGNNWIAVNNGMWNGIGPPLYFDVYDFIRIGDKLFVATIMGVFYTTDGGDVWKHTSLFGELEPCYVFAKIDTVLFVTTPSGIRRTTNLGSEWSSVNNGLPNTDYFHSITATHNELYTGSYAGSYGIYKSCNFGTSWIPVNNGLIDSNVYSIYYNKNTLLLTTESKGIFRSTDSGIHWNTYNDGLSDTNMVTQEIFSDKIFIYIPSYRGFFRRPISEVTSVKMNSTIFPSEFNLAQNYPNPFNASTNIKYTIPKGSYVKIVVYDILGRKLKTLINGEKSEGTFIIQLSANDLSSGVYYYQLQTKEFIQTKKLILIK